MGKNKLLLGAVLSLFIISCSQQEDNFKININRPVQKIKFDSVELSKQEEELKQMISINVDPLLYQNKKDPFKSAIDAYAEANSIAALQNPLAMASLDHVRLIGVMNSSVGNVAAVEFDNKSYYLRVGDKIGLYNGIVIDITSSSLRVRQNERDHFGRNHVVVKDLFINNKGGKI